MSEPVRITLLSDMAARGPAEQASLAAEWKVRTLDIRHVDDQSITVITEAEADAIAVPYEAHDIGVEAFSSNLFSLPIEDNRAAFEAHLVLLDTILKVARRLKPRAIRLIAAQSKRRKEITDSFAYVQKEQPWLLPFYAEAVDRIHAAGFAAVIENETGGSIFGKPDEIVAFFDALGRRDKVSLTWDVANLWHFGRFPTLEVYQQLKPYIGYLHVKGGIAGERRELKWRSSLEAASWPVLDILRAAIADGVTPSICLNQPHGETHPDHPLDNLVWRDLEFLRRELGPSVV